MIQCADTSWSSGRFADTLSRPRMTNRCSIWSKTLVLYSYLYFDQDRKLRSRIEKYINLEIHQQVRYYVEHCSLGDWLVLYQMARNMNKRFFAEFLYVLARLVIIAIDVVINITSIMIVILASGKWIHMKRETQRVRQFTRQWWRGISNTVRDTTMWKKDIKYRSRHRTNWKILNILVEIQQIEKI